MSIEDGKSKYGNGGEGIRGIQNRALAPIRERVLTAIRAMAQDGAALDDITSALMERFSLDPGELNALKGLAGEAGVRNAKPLSQKDYDTHYGMPQPGSETCPECGATENKPGYLMRGSTCRYCGKEITPIKNDGKHEGSSYICEKCGYKMSASDAIEGDGTCPQCGKEVEDSHFFNVTDSDDDELRELKEELAYEQDRLRSYKHTIEGDQIRADIKRLKERIAGLSKMSNADRGAKTYSNPEGDVILTPAGDGKFKTVFKAKSGNVREGLSDTWEKAAELGKHWVQEEREKKLNGEKAMKNAKTLSDLRQELDLLHTAFERAQKAGDREKVASIRAEIEQKYMAIAKADDDMRRGRQNDVEHNGVDVGKSRYGNEGCGIRNVNPHFSDVNSPEAKQLADLIYDALNKMEEANRSGDEQTSLRMDERSRVLARRYKQMTGVSFRTVA